MNFSKQEFLVRGCDFDDNFGELVVETSRQGAALKWAKIYHKDGFWGADPYDVLVIENDGRKNTEPEATCFRVTLQPDGTWKVEENIQNLKKIQSSENLYVWAEVYSWDNDWNFISLDGKKYVEFTEFFHHMMKFGIS